jgi:hypothetical protein
VAKVTVSNAKEKGNNFVMTSGTGPTLDLRKITELLNFRPITVIDATAFSREFFVLGNDLQWELIYPNTTGVSAYGPDFSDPITGTYHAQGSFLKPNTESKISAEITSIGFQKPTEGMIDCFGLK